MSIKKGVLSGINMETNCAFIIVSGSGFQSLDAAIKKLDPHTLRKLSTVRITPLPPQWRGKGGGTQE